MLAVTNNLSSFFSDDNNEITTYHCSIRFFLGCLTLYRRIFGDLITCFSSLSMCSAWRIGGYSSNICYDGKIKTFLSDVNLTIGQHYYCMKIAKKFIGIIMLAFNWL